MILRIHLYSWKSERRSSLLEPTIEANFDDVNGALFLVNNSVDLGFFSCVK
jgi:hypothetical protein